MAKVKIVKVEVLREASADLVEAAANVFLATLDPGDVISVDMEAVYNNAIIIDFAIMVVYYQHNA